MVSDGVPMSEDRNDPGSASESSEEEEEDASGSEDEAGSWISWFCSLKGNEFFCEVEEDYIQDDFNLSGLSSQVPYYDYALDLILNADTLQDEVLTEAQQELVESAAEALYGLIHQRYILTARGLAAMADKYKNVDFGRCPRVFCNGQPCLPVGLSDVPRQTTVKLFCPKCEDVFYPRSKYHGNLDGAYFGTTFPHLFLLTYPELRPAKASESYVPKVFGFKIHPSAYNRDGTNRTRRPAVRRVSQQQQSSQQPSQQQSQQQQQQPQPQPSGGAEGSRPSSAAAASQQQQQQPQPSGGTTHAKATET